VEILPPKFYDIFVRTHSKRKGKNEDELEPDVQVFFCGDSVGILLAGCHPKSIPWPKLKKFSLRWRQNSGQAGTESGSEDPSGEA